MKTSERKIKQQMSFAEVPAYIRCLADAIEREGPDLPEELTDLPSPIAKLEVKGKALGSVWEIKIKVKAEPVAHPESERADGPEVVEAAPALVPQAKTDYRQIKKRMKTAFKAIGDGLAAQSFPPPEILSAFLDEAERMTTYSGAAYGEAHYPIFQEACRKLSEGFASRNLDAFKAAYTTLAQLKKECHQACK